MSKMTKELADLLASELDSVTGGGLRSWSFGALSALSIGMGSPAGGKIDQPIMPPSIVRPAGSK